MVDSDASNSGDRDDIPNVMNEELHDHPDMSERLKDDCALPLWPGCTKFSKLSAVLTLYNLKVGHQVSDVFFTAMLTAVSEQRIPLEYSGRVRGVGWGVTKTSLQAVSTMSELSRLKRDVSYLINEIKELKCKGHKTGVQSGVSSHMDNFDMDNEVLGEPDDLDHVLGEDLPEGTNACYLYLDPGRRYVGRGILHNDLTDKILHGVPLEEEYVRVHFEVAEKSQYNSPLPRPCDEANLVGQAVSTKLEV
ncbi:hypothetical protein POM88_019369 [Heracleum sosnowskyi]|uniref:Uncharacterized protein n=1 Tax=Heracleum sosnowskyi TaxID=360622 RepID=A0AAD8IT39_9APIA|nr:hypothetical protein POM88_019369 [Heracleum sosnowskyi]